MTVDVPTGEGRDIGMRRLEVKLRDEDEESSNQSGLDVDGVKALRRVILVLYVPDKDCELDGSTLYRVHACNRADREETLGGRSAEIGIYRIVIGIDNEFEGLSGF